MTTDAEKVAALRALADHVWAESQADATIIRDAGIMQNIVLRIDEVLGTPER